MAFIESKQSQHLYKKWYIKVSITFVKNFILTATVLSATRQLYQNLTESLKGWHVEKFIYCY